MRAAYIHKAQFLEQRRLVMAWWSNFIDANRLGHVTPHEFAHPVGDDVTVLPNGHGSFNRGEPVRPALAALSRGSIQTELQSRPVWMNLTLKS